MSARKEVTIGITINLENYENLRLEVSGEAESQEGVDDLITFLDGILARIGRGDQATAERVDAYRRRVLAAGPAVPKAPDVPAHREEEKVSPPSGFIEAVIPRAPEHPEPPQVPRPAVQTEARPAVQAEAKPAVQAEAKPPVQAEAKPAVQTEARPAVQTEARPAVQAEARPAVQTEAKPAVQTEAKPAVQAEVKPAVQAGVKPAVQAPPQQAPAPEKPSSPGAADICEACGAEVTKSQAKLSQLFMSKTLCKKCMEQP